ncbi:hypothetical protein ACTODO_01080 [Schaalia dentiphila ATCC 17982]|uniref:Uncharacterized protein n=1 Tax=Schaalia dentiphila ATCC 17982 TaxID=411466 RepID=A7BBQ9_9ACTO|nr:hypothetical protein ACTODO_01080 [Schaalia odontolytica ATCC 17982]
MAGVCLMYEGEFCEHSPPSESLAGVVADDEGVAVGVGRTLGVGTGSAWATPGPNAPESSGEKTGAAIGTSASPAISEAPTRPRPKDRERARRALT